jgi:hypothetical protein
MKPRVKYWLVIEQMESSIFWDIKQCSPLIFNGRFGEICRLHLQDRRIKEARNEHEAGSAYYETSVDFQRRTRRYIPENRILHNHRCENLKSYNIINCK